MDSNVALFWSYTANLAVQFVDSYLTARAVSKTGLQNEGNPLTRWMLKKFGVAGMAGIKIGALPFAGIIVEALSKHPWAFNGTVAAITVPVLIWNVIQLKKEKISIF